jgi:phosphoribosylamine-glycine ligase
MNGQLASLDIQFQKDSYAVGVVLASGGYPETFQTGYAISGSCDELCHHFWSTLVTQVVNVNQLVLALP